MVKMIIGKNGYRYNILSRVHLGSSTRYYRVIQGNLRSGQRHHLHRGHGYSAGIVQPGGQPAFRAFDAGALVKVGNNDMFTLNVGARATPTLVHWNDDGMLDLVVGGLDGLIHLYYNCGCDGWVPPHFYFSSPDGYPFVQAGARDLKAPSGRSSPEFADLDGDAPTVIVRGIALGELTWGNSRKALVKELERKFEFLFAQLAIKSAARDVARSVKLVKVPPDAVATGERALIGADEEGE